MENSFNNRDFEQFLKKNADQYRMYPSEKVWKGIHNNLHTRRRWYGLGLALLLLTSGTVTWIMLDSTSKNRPLASTELSTVTKNSPVTVSPAVVQTPSPVRKHIDHKNSPTATNTLFIADQIKAQDTPDDFPVSYTVMAKPEPVKTETPVTLIVHADKTDNAPRAANPQSRVNNILNSKLVTRAETKTSLIAQTEIPVVIDSPVPAEQKEKAKESAPKTSVAAEYPLTIESVVNNYKYRKSRSKVSLELFVTPTVSYRKLADNQDFLIAAARSNNTPNLSYVSIADINSVVTHKPDLGIEMGMNAGLPVGRSLRFTAGLQVNVSKYDIRAFTHTPEMTTIALNTGGGAGNSVSTVTSYRNLNVSNSNWLQNLYVSASLPVGAEIKLLRARNTYFGVGATVQPTYILSDRVYLLSTDYKNYAEVPSLIRRWNVNSSFETFVGYTLGHTKWRVGPQIRYQMMSSFVDKYPVKEHLFDYGLKLGLMLR
jgi:hypothetical protein